MDFGRLTLNSGGEQMLLFGGAGGGYLGGSPAAMAGVEETRRKRPFATMLQEGLQLQEEELYEQLAALERERKARRLTAEQVVALERSFEEGKHRKLESERKSELARRLGMAPRQVAVWFQNRRARWKAKQLEQDFDRLRAAHDELLAGRDALLVDNDRLRSQVTSLTKKLQSRAESPPPASEPDRQTTASATEVKTAAADAPAARRAAQALEEGTGGAVCAEASTGNGSPESYFAGARSPPASSEDDCCIGGGSGGGVSDEYSALFLPDAVLDVAAGAEEEAHLSNWAWFWN